MREDTVEGSYAKVIVYEVVRRWQASGKKIWRALTG